jgi:hypothetical protein
MRERPRRAGGAGEEPPNTRGRYKGRRPLRGGKSVPRPADESEIKRIATSDRREATTNGRRIEPGRARPARRADRARAFGELGTRCTVAPLRPCRSAVPGVPPEAASKNVHAARSFPPTVSTEMARSVLTISDCGLVANGESLHAGHQTCIRSGGLRGLRFVFRMFFQQQRR